MIRITVEGDWQTPDRITEIEGKPVVDAPTGGTTDKLDLENELLVASALCAAKDAEIERLRKALTAIKEWTLKQDDTVWFDTITQYTLHDLCDQAITAAAEVGPTWHEEYTNAVVDLKKVRADEREACARLVEKHERNAWNTRPETLAAAIRAREDT
jgi:hypothetical protein